MLRLVGILVLSVGFTLFVFVPSLADEDTLGASVTPCTVAAGVSDGGVAFGTLNLSPSSASPVKRNTVVGDANGGAAETQTITNTGTCAADIWLRSSNAVGGTTPWDLVACSAVGADAFALQYEVGDLGGTFTGTDFPGDNTVGPDAGDVVALVGSVALDLGICMPTSSTDATQKIITVTVVLTAQ